MISLIPYEPVIDISPLSYDMLSDYHKREKFDTFLKFGDKKIFWPVTFTYPFVVRNYDKLGFMDLKKIAKFRRIEAASRRVNKLQLVKILKDWDNEYDNHNIAFSLDYLEDTGYKVVG